MGIDLIHIVYAAYGLGMLVAVVWLVSKFVTHYRREREGEARLFDLMGKDDFRVYAERLKQEQEAAQAVAAETTEDAPHTGQGLQQPEHGDPASSESGTRTALEKKP